ncbi:hypothetical protein JTB14_025399 [Gonioctena quinquepunctata]|nr:hypothetical protein JTB14_025399 [Gonioctena quinquepunctata]
MLHDIAYSQSKDIKARRIYEQLASFASERLKAPDAKFGENVTAFVISNIMINMKTKLGMYGIETKEGYLEKKKGGQLKFAIEERKST